MIDTTLEVKECVRCNEVKPLAEFIPRKDRKTPYRNYCKDCDSKRRKELYNKKVEYERKQAKKRHWENREVLVKEMRLRRLKARYGITVQQYEDLLKSQNYCCPICLLHQDDHRQNMHVDHDHETGEIRGLLCAICNRYFTGSQRTEEKFQRAIDYLKGPFTGWFLTGNESYK